MNNEAGLAGREAELAQLNSFLWPAIAGQGKMVFVTGRAEINSRAFVEAVLSQVQTMHPTLTVALGECRAGGPPYLPFTEIMRLLTGDVTGELTDNALSANNADRLRGLLRVSGEALMEMGPSLLNLFVDGAGLLANASLLLAGNVPWLERLRRRQAAGPQVRQERLEEGRLFEEYSDVLIAIARQQPLVLGLLDLQWADEGSIGLLFQLSRRIKDVSLLIIWFSPCATPPMTMPPGRPFSRRPVATSCASRWALYPAPTRCASRWRPAMASTPPATAAMRPSAWGRNRRCGSASSPPRMASDWCSPNSSP